MISFCPLTSAISLADRRGVDATVGTWLSPMMRAAFIPLDAEQDRPRIVISLLSPYTWVPVGLLL